MSSHADHNTSAEPQTTDLDARIGHSPVRMRVKTTPAGLLAIGTLVSGILLGVAAIVQTAHSGKRGRKR